MHNVHISLLLERPLKLEWIDDLLAIADAGSLSAAANRRFLTQPAFSRRVRAIEQSVGAELIDRSRKPVQLKKSVLDQEPKLRELSQSLHAIRHELGRESLPSGELVIVSQHAISTAIAPQLIKSIVKHQSVRVRLRSANREECYSMLFTHQAAIGLLYQIDDDHPSDSEPFVNTARICSEPLVPLIAPQQLEHFRRDLASGFIRVIAYPQSVFLGGVLSRHVQPQLSESISIQWVAETALTTAAMQFAAIGTGLAWVPQSLAASSIERGELILLDQELPSVSMTVVAVQLVSAGGELIERTWDILQSTQPDVPTNNPARPVD